MNNTLYTGPFKEHIQNYIELKRAIGYKCSVEADRLKCFDRFTLQNYPQATVLTKEIVCDWCSKKTYEAQANQSARASAIRQLGKYIDSLGLQAYIIPNRYYPAAKQYVPYIYTTDELARFFAETDKCRSCHTHPYRHQIMPVLFRMIYMCGLRSSEARLINRSSAPSTSHRLNKISCH